MLSPEEGIEEEREDEAGRGDQANKLLLKEKNIFEVSRS